MRLPRLARQFERTCSDCGYSWRVAREFARKGIIPIQGATSGIRGGRAAARPEATGLRAGRALAERVERLRICPKCGAKAYVQRPVR